MSKYVVFYETDGKLDFESWVELIKSSASPSDKFSQSSAYGKTADDKFVRGRYNEEKN